MKVLLIDHDPEVVSRLNLRDLNDVVHLPGIDFYSAAGGTAGCDAARRVQPDLVLLDLTEPNGKGIEVLRGLLSENPRVEIIVLAAESSRDQAIEAIRQGASGCLVKPFDMDALADGIRRRAEGYATAGHDGIDGGFREREGIVGRSPALLAALERIAIIGPHFRTALITGETGTGKDLAARALHRLSGATGPFVVCNCAAIVETLFESELFGYQRGAFTGAAQDKMGLVEHANGGTLFLDEIGELPSTTQAKLLRVLQTREVQRVGSLTPRKVDVRIIGATNRDLKVMVGARDFREDLYFRLAIVEIKMPKLADRLEDLPLLADAFLDRCAALYQTSRQRLSRRAQVFLEKHNWPGNIRELENVIAYCCMMSRETVIDAADLPAYLQGSSPGPDPEPASEPISGPVSMQELRLDYVAEVLDRVDGNRARAAQILKIGRTTLHRYLKSAAME